MILNKIVAHKRQALKAQKEAVPLAQLRALSAGRPHPLSLAAALRRPGVALIAEVKRASPSKGVFSADLDAARLAETYVAGGAAAISVLTDERFFRGTLQDLTRVKSAVSNSRAPVPVMRKDFIIDPYQVVESCAYGADALLLIASILSQDLLSELLALTHEMGMLALVEIHDQTELERAVRLSPQLVGINNRNLEDFSVDLATFGRLRPRLPREVVAVAESGVHSAADLRALREMGADAVLVGEALVTAPDVAAKVREFADGGGMEGGDTGSEAARR
jgi:indole-3-glycerol phosphate synthase